MHWFSWFKRLTLVKQQEATTTHPTLKLPTKQHGIDRLFTKKTPVHQTKKKHQPKPPTPNPPKKTNHGKCICVSTFKPPPPSKKTKGLPCWTARVVLYMISPWQPWRRGVRPWQLSGKYTMELNLLVVYPLWYIYLDLPKGAKWV